MVVLQPRTAETKSSAEKSQSESCIKQSTAKHAVAGARKSVSDDVIDLTDNNNVEKIVAKVLQLARIADIANSRILTWYYQELDALLIALARRYLHTRPKGPARRGRGRR